MVTLENLSLFLMVPTPTQNGVPNATSDVAFRQITWALVAKYNMHNPGRLDTNPSGSKIDWNKNTQSNVGQNVDEL